MQIENTIANVKKWFVESTSSYPYIVAPGLRQWTADCCRRYQELNFGILFGIRFVNNGSEAYFLADEQEYFNSAKTLSENLDWMERYYRDFIRDEKKFKAFVALINKHGYNYLYNNFRKFMKAYDDEYVSGFTIDGFLVFGDTLVEEMKKKYPEHEKEIFTLTRIYGESFGQREKRDMLKIVVLVKMSGKNFDSIESLLKNKELKKKLEKHQQNYHWILNNYKKVEALPVEHFAKELLELLKKDLKSLQEELGILGRAVENHKKECKAIRKKNILSENDYEKLLWIGKVAWWVDRRKEYNLIANHYLGVYLKWVAKKLKVKYEDLAFLSEKELNEVLAGRKKLSDFPIKERQKEGVLFYDKYDNEIFLTGDEAKNLWKKISPEVSGSSEEIKGQVASKGFARGIARVIRDPHGKFVFNEGDILVTGMTRPDYLQLMKIASAIVTDEGGVTCHAAIISREMKKPCIISTRVATKVLKDGDMVEVDANIGIIKTLKRVKQ